MNEDKLDSYKTAITTAQADKDQDVEDLEDIQNIINKKNKDLGETKDKDKAAEAVNKAENQIQLLNALTANFERVNKDWIVAYDTALKVEENKEKAHSYDEIQTAIDVANQEKINGVTPENAKDQAAKTALIEKWMKPDAEKETAKAKAIESSKLKEAEFKVYEANTANRLYSALVNYANLLDDAEKLDVKDIKEANKTYYFEKQDEAKVTPEEIVEQGNEAAAEKANEAAKKAAEEAIEALPEDITLEDEDAVKAARKLVDDLAEEKQPSNLNKLTTAEAKIAELKLAKGYVTNEEELKTALDNDDVKVITLENNIKTEAAVVLKDNKTIDGKGYTLIVGTSGDGESSAKGLYIPNDVKNVVIKNLTVKGTHGDNLIEIYSNATLENVKAIGGKKAGIYVNNDKEATITVNFKNIETAGNGWDAGVGIVSKKLNSKVIANFEGIKAAEKVAVYTDDINKYHGEYEINGLDDFRKELVNDRDADTGKITQTQWKWFTK